MWRDFGYFVFCYHTLMGDEQGQAKAKYLKFDESSLADFEERCKDLSHLCQLFQDNGLTIQEFRKSLGLYNTFDDAKVFVACSEASCGEFESDVDYVLFEEPTTFETSGFKVEFTIKHPALESCNRAYFKPECGKIQVLNEMLKIDPYYSRRKLGTLLVYQSALSVFEGACSHLFDMIVADGGKNAEFFGYYHWPRVGFDVSPDCIYSIRTLADMMEVESFFDMSDDQLEEWRDVGVPLLLALTPDLWIEFSKDVMQSYLHRYL